MIPQLLIQIPILTVPILASNTCFHAILSSCGWHDTLGSCRIENSNASKDKQSHEEHCWKVFCYCTFNLGKSLALLFSIVPICHSNTIESNSLYLICLASALLEAVFHPNLCKQFGSKYWASKTSPSWLHTRIHNTSTDICNRPAYNQLLEPNQYGFIYDITVQDLDHEFCQEVMNTL